MATKASIGYRMPNGRIYYVNCRFDGDLKHVGVLLVEKYNDLAKALESCVNATNALLAAGAEFLRSVGADASGGAPPGGGPKAP